MINKYFVTFMNDNNATMIFLKGWILAPNQLLCQMLFSDTIITNLPVNGVLVELYYQICAMATVLIAQT